MIVQYMMFAALLAQLPPGAQAELDRLQILLQTAADKPAVTYQIAQTWAAVGDKRKALEWLGRAVGLNVGFDVERDSRFTALRDDPPFRQLADTARASTPPVKNSRLAFQVAEGDLVPESLAWDALGGHFYFGSMGKNKILRCDVDGVCRTFAAGLGVVLGMKVDASGQTLWAAVNADEGSGLFEFDLNSGATVGKHMVPAGRHLLNDLAITRTGDVYVTDTRGNQVFVLPHGAGELRPMVGAFRAANGIALSRDEKRLYVSAFGDGIAVVDIASGVSRPIARPADLCLANVDGLYAWRDSLIAIQNGVMTPRVVRFFLDKTGLAIGGYQVLERRNPLFNGVTTGVLVANEFYYMANIQDEKRSGDRFDPISVLKLSLQASIR